MRICLWQGMHLSTLSPFCCPRTFLSIPPAKASQVEEIARLYHECFLDFNTSCGAHSEAVSDDFGDPDIARHIPVATRCVASIFLCETPSPMPGIGDLVHRHVQCFRSPTLSSPGKYPHASFLADEESNVIDLS